MMSGREHVNPTIGQLRVVPTSTWLVDGRHEQWIVGTNRKAEATTHARRPEMRRLSMSTNALFCALLVLRTSPSAAPMPASAPQQIDLSAAKLRAVNREVTPLTGDRRGVHLSEKEGNGIAWIEGTDFANGTIEADIRGRDVLQRSFVGIAFHGRDENTYEAVYLRPFNFRSQDDTRRQHAVQYISVPDYDWPRLRKEFPEEFENPVDAAITPTDWVPLRIIVADKTVEIHVGTGKAPALEVRKLGQLERGLVGLWVGNNSDGDFANLRLTPAK